MCALTRAESQILPTEQTAMVRVSSTQPASPEVEEALIINDTKPDRSNAKPQLQVCHAPNRLATSQ